MGCFTLFWREFAKSKDLVSDWTRGSFSGRGLHQGHDAHVTLTGVLLLTSSVASIIRGITNQDDKPPSPKLSPLSDATLNKWWESLVDVRDSFPQRELLLKIRSKYPQRFISRDRLRKVIGSRKRGPLLLRGKDSAK